ncbi:MAG: hypothetical protein AABZ06_01900 [Bdellovibrionota bacterium]
MVNWSVYTRRLITLMSLLLAAGVNETALASSLSLSLDAVLPAEVVKPMVKATGYLSNHRPYHGAAPMSGASLDLGLEATLVHAPDDFSTSSSATGLGSVGSLPSMPIAKVHIHKGLSPTSDIGISGLYYKGSYIAGVGMKFILHQPEEGPTWALRLSYSTTKVDFAKLSIPSTPLLAAGVSVGSLSIILKTRTIATQVLASKKLYFVEPYIGAGLEWITGQIDAVARLNIVSTVYTLSTKSYSSYSLSAFSGVLFKPGYAGLMLALEGSYNTEGMHYLGILIGFGF